ncbi:MAG: hypothetical protein A2X94_04460 [Bdellovibrionales bacterium GWB1_55_8]|nr:MAG: hypothetical protein A2X94_04460 [Bdellovibrionales bacterium GWB1_55_8]
MGRRVLKKVRMRLLFLAFAMLTSSESIGSGFSGFSFWKPGLPGPYTWTGKGADSNWNTPGNWFANAVPNSTQRAYFDSRYCTGIKCNATLNVNPNVKGIYIAPNFTGTLTQSSGVDVTIGSEGWVQSGGTFAGGDSAMTVTNKFTLSGGSFQATSGVWTMTGAVVYAVNGNPSFNSNGGTLSFTPNTTTASVTPGLATYNHVTFRGSWVGFNLNAGTMNVAGTLTVGNAFGGNYAMNSGTIAASGNVTIADYGYVGTAIIRLTGNAGGQTITGAGSAPCPNLTIDAGANNVTLSGIITVAGDFQLSSVGTLNTAGSTLVFAGGNTRSIVPGTVTYNDVKFQGTYGTYNLNSGTMNIGGNLTIGDQSGGNQGINSGTLAVTGNVNVAGYGNVGSAVIQLTGNAAGQTITGAGTAPLPNLNITAGANPVTLSGTITVVGNYQLSSVGTFNVTGSTLVFAAGTSRTITPGAATYGNVKFHGTYANYDLSSGTMKIGGDLTLGDPVSTNNAINSGTLSVAGNVTITGNGYIGTSIVEITGNASGQTITGGGAAAPMPHLTIAAGANNVSISGTLLVQGNYTVTSGTVGAGGSTLILYANNKTVTITPGSALYNDVTLKGYYGTLNCTGSLNASGNVSLVSMAGPTPWNMPDPGGSYSISIGGTLTLSAGSTLNLHGAALTYGSLSNSGAVNL